MARIAVSAATYFIDRPYEYLVPEELTDLALPGKRVLVPFSRGNRLTEGMILAVSDESKRSELKAVARIIDDEPVLSPDHIRLALFMRERFFCTVYDAVKSMLPVGLWLDSAGKKRIGDRKMAVARILPEGEAALPAFSGPRQKAPQQARLIRELASYGEMPLNDLLCLTGAGKSSFNALVSAGYADVYYREVFKRPVYTAGEKAELPVLNEEQQKVYEGIRDFIREGKNVTALIQGVTGSGKTSVYISLIADALNCGKSAVLLVPEIALTPQMLRTFSSYFGENIAVLHSSLTTAERYDEWKRIRSGRARLVIGTRSAVFAPCSEIGIIIIDEEQEDTYKSENPPRYNAEDVAKYIAYRASCPLVLGSATPKITSRYYAETGRYLYFRLDRRYNEMRLPEVTVVDMKNELKKGNTGNISSFLRDEIAANIERGEQSILFLNRRGANKFVTCGECGYIYKCPNCSVSLTYHSVGNKLMCHYCGYTQRVDWKCPECGGILNYVGAGTQLIEQELNELFPETPVLRMDTDVLSATVTHEKLFGKFRNEKIPVMIGTQMVSKGLNFENVTLVGVISADQSLYCGDFRASERTFSMLTQVIGRSGRGEKQGRAVIQTFTPSNEVIRLASLQDYDGFYETEILSRQLQDSPPFSDLFAVFITGENEPEVRNAAKYIRDQLKYMLKDHSNIEILGPMPLAVVRVSNRFRYRINLKCLADSEVRNAISSSVVACSTDKRFKGISFYADYDPGEN